MLHKHLAGGLIAAMAAAVAAAPEHVQQLGKDTFKPFVENHEVVLAKFYAPWCGHCKALAPEYEEAASSLKAKDIHLAEIDCTKESELCEEHAIEGYPTLKVFRRDPKKSTPYNGLRKAAGIVSYMTKQSLPPVSDVKKDTIEEFKKADNIVLIAYFAADDKTSNSTFTAVANEHRDDYLFGAVNDEALAKEEGVEFPSIVLYKTFDEGKNTFVDKFEATAIKDFMKAASIPLVGEIGPDTFGQYVGAGKPIGHIFAETEKERTRLAEALKPIAMKHQKKLIFGTVDAEKYGAHAGNLNLKTDKFPCFAIHDVTDNKKFTFDQDLEVTYDNIAAFVEKFVDGKIDPSIKSEPVPEKQDGPVTIVVAKNYEDIVMDDAKDVLIEFYAPWCGHCKALAPKYDDLGSMVAKSSFKDKVVVAKVDATANDVPDQLSGFPTIKLFPAGDKKNPITYEGARTIEDLAKFIEEKGKHKAVVLDKKSDAASTTAADADKAEGEKKADEGKKADKEEGGPHDEL